MGQNQLVHKGHPMHALRVRPFHRCPVLLLTALTRIVRFRIIRIRMKKPATLPIVPALERATHAVALWIERAFPDLRLTQAEAHVLAYLAVHASCSINDLHHSFGHKRSTLTSLLDRLESRGWIRRTAHPTSRRLVQVELTDTGRPVAEQVSAAVCSLEERLLARVGQQDATTFLQVIQILEEELQ
jgi:DNA-binding MarR family transcriptional regulator